MFSKRTWIALIGAISTFAGGCPEPASRPEPTPLAIDEDGEVVFPEDVLHKLPDPAAAIPMLTARLAGRSLTTNEQTMTFFLDSNRFDFCGDGRFRQERIFFGVVGSDAPQISKGSWRVVFRERLLALELDVSESADAAPFQTRIPLGLTAEGTLIFGIFPAETEPAGAFCD